MAEARTTLERKTGVSLWRQIAQILALEIKSGEFAPGTKLPTEPHLARRFGVNRHTVRRALSVLQEDGQVSIEQGRGTFVAEQVAGYALAPGAHQVGSPFSTEMGRTGHNDGGELLHAEHQPATAKVAAALALRPGEDVILLELIHRADNRPVSVSSHYFPAHRFAGLEDRFNKTHSLTQTLKAFGISVYSQKQTKVSASLPNPHDSRILKMPKGQPVVVAENVNVDMEGRAIEFTISRSAGSRMQLVFER